MLKFLHAADIHLDSALHKLEAYEGAPLKALRQATRKALGNLVALAISEGVDFVLIAGDLYDGEWKDYNTGLYLVSQIRRLRQAGIRVFIVAGNHDAASRITRSLRLPEGVKFYRSDAPETCRIKGLDVAVHGQSFASPAIRKDLSSRYPPPVPGYYNIGLLHTCATGRQGHEPYAPCTIEGLASKGYDYWALGHVHQREVLLDDPLIVFPGNIQGRHIRETGSKGCMVVSVDDRGRSQVEFKSLDVIRWKRIRVDASGVEETYDLIDLIIDGLEKNLSENEGLPLIARIEIGGVSRVHEAFASDPERWKNEIRSAAVDSSGDQVWIEKVNLLTGTSEWIEDRTWTGPIGELLQYLEELRTDVDELISLGGTLGELGKRLPREFREDPESAALDNPHWLGKILEQVRPMLLHRLMKKEGVR